MSNIFDVQNTHTSDQSIDDDEEDLMPSSESPNRRSRISRVVIVQDGRKDFYEDAGDDMNNFFDTDNFWSGSITWY